MVELSLQSRTLPYQDPLVVFERLGRGRPHGILLESAEVDSKRHLQSFLLTDAAVRFVCRGRQVQATSLTPNGRRLLSDVDKSFSLAPLPGVHIRRTGETVEWTFPETDPRLDEDQRLVAPFVFEPLRRLQTGARVLSDEPHALFVAGLLAYDLVESFEPLPKAASTDNCPDFVFFVAERMIRFDHLAQNATAFQISVGTEGEPSPPSGPDWDLFLRQIELPTNNTECPIGAVQCMEPIVDISDERFCEIVRRLKQEIYNGVVFQAVPSRSFSYPCPDPILAYRHLRQANPSPYMFFLKDEDFVLFGASPETAVKFVAENRAVELCPIAGTRPRGFGIDGRIDLDLDSRIELELRTDQKEMAEHLMLVDLARNDLARICEPGTRHVAQLLRVDRYSHVMHLVSRVKGELRAGLDALHAYQACMNMGTLSGAPKVQAMQLIRELEGKRRGSYGGAVGYLNGRGDFDSCIVIRSAFVQSGVARVQAGAGVVHDSDPQAEAQETRSKAQAVLSALHAAESSSSSGGAW